jgi:radical SAM protein with 4Fe4S-binding SPASM domain
MNAEAPETAVAFAFACQPVASNGMWEVAELPSELQIEVTASCNLRCRMCLVGYRPAISRKSGALSLDLYKRLLDTNPHLRRVTLQGLGEPLLAPDLLEMVQLASERGIDVGFNTNGILLTRARSRALVAAGLAWLHVSLDGATASTYESIREKADFRRVVANIGALVEVKREAGTSNPRLQLNFVAMRRNVRELPALVRLAGEWGLDRLWVQNLSHSFEDTDPSGGYAGIRRFARDEALWSGDDLADAKRAFARARREGRRLGVRLRLPVLHEDPLRRRAPGEPGCDWPWRSAYVNHDGTVQPCCMLMGSERGTLGSVSKTSFAQVWNGARYRRFRNRLLTDNSPPDVCRGCSAYRGVF